ncbi:hypothetical protein KPH14_013108 [Odynerus spinipes]|uniref:Uncharacterized protein n=1 Tax=Odynerus spinipes TaxID=1348599 RepID=A0AAD9R830_9HYME|nr:hypothetical protein KPH14_013108 [Odynerus spinipes]
MFGDYRGQNCEDAYIFDESSRPFVDNCVQLKVNYYKFDRAIVNFEKLKFFLKPVTQYHNPNGCTFFLGYLFSPYKLSFGSTFVHIKVIKCNADMWLYRFYYTNWSSYLRPDQRVMQDSPDESTSRNFDAIFRDRGLQFDPSTLTERINDRSVNGVAYPVGSAGGTSVGSSASGTSSSSERTMTRIIYEASCLTYNRNVELSVQMTTRQIRFSVVMKNLQIVQKLQNNCGQKGVATYCDLSDLYTEKGGRVHAIVSIYSVNGRQLLSQILEQYSLGGQAARYDRRNLMRVYSKSRNGAQVGWAGYGEFFFSCDSPHDNIIVSSPNFGNNAMRMCNMTYFAAIGNNLSTWIMNRAADYVNYKNNPMNSMPVNIQNCLTVYHYFNRQIYPHALRVRELRKKIKYWYELMRRGIVVDLPTSIKL